MTRKAHEVWQRKFDKKGAPTQTAVAVRLGIDFGGFSRSLKYGLPLPKGKTWEDVESAFEAERRILEGAGK